MPRHFEIFALGPEQLWWKRKAVNPHPGLVDAVERAKVDNLLFLVARTRRLGAVIEAKAGIYIRPALR
jgi:hypothetical protein